MATDFKWISDKAGAVKVNWLRLSGTFTWCFFIWSFRLVCHLKPLPQTSQMYGVMPVWFRSCFRSACFFLNVFPHVLQTCARSSLWTQLMWEVREFDRANCKPHSGQMCCRMFWWSFWCSFKSLLVQNSFWHSSHENSRTPLCLARWRFKLCREMKASGHWLHLCRRSSVCRNWWPIRELFFPNDLLHMEHLKGFRPVWLMTCRLISAR